MIYDQNVLKCRGFKSVFKVELFPGLMLLKHITKAKLPELSYLRRSLLSY